MYAFKVSVLLAVLAGFMMASAYASDDWVPWFTGKDEEYVKLKIGVFPDGAGSVYPSPGVYEVKRGATVVLQVAGVSGGYEFSHWVVNFVDYGSTPFKTLTLEGDAEVAAIFTTAASGEEAGYLVVDVVFYDNPSEPPRGYVALWELGTSIPLSPVQISVYQWHGQAVFKGVRVGRTYTVVLSLENGVGGTYVNHWFTYATVSYMPWGLISSVRKTPGFGPTAELFGEQRSWFEPINPEEWPGWPG